MKHKVLYIIKLAFLCCCLLSLMNCEARHECSYDNQIATDEYLKATPTCQSPAVYYYSCSCGRKSETKTFTYGDSLQHNYNMSLAVESALKREATCTTPAVYYYSCSCGRKSETKTFTHGDPLPHNYNMSLTVESAFKCEADCTIPAQYYYSCYCGAIGNESFSYGNCLPHSFSIKAVEAKYLKSEATMDVCEVYYKSCKCGAIGEETFEHGSPITVLSQEEKALYMPTSLTISIYDTKNLTYGFTYNTDSKPLRPVIQIEKGESLTENCEQYLCNVTEATSYNSSDKLFTYYIVKVEVALEPNTTYAYRVYDKYADIGTEVTTFTTTNPAATSFKFAHVSDSQVNGVDSEKTGTDTGIAFGNTLAEIVGNNDFIVHTGDVVEWSKYEAYWDNMLDYNFEYLSKIAMNAISGNHEAVYRSGSNETYKHFNNKIPEQDSTLKGYYYSFEYGNVKFIMLNTNHRNADDTLHVEQYNWLINELENNDCLWTIVSLHNPIYSVGKYGLSSSYNNVCLALRRQLQGVFAEYDVDIVLQGHDHAISRTKPVDKNGNPTVENWITEDGIEYSVDPNGVLYLMNGPSGSQAREVYKADKNASTIESYYHYAEKSNASSWAEFEVDGDTITVTVKYVDDEGVHDYYTWGIKKTIK